MEATATDYPQTQTREGNTPKLFSSISDLPFFEYVHAACTGDHSKIENWEEVQQQFNDALGTAVNDNIILYAEIEGLNKQYELIKAFAIILKSFPIEGVKEELLLLDPDYIDGDLDGVLARAEALLMDIESKIEALGATAEDEKDKSGPTHQTFVEICAMLSRHHKLSIRLNDPGLMTSEFISHYKAFIEESKRPDTANSSED